MAKKNSVIDNINIRMYRVGTGDFFLLQFMSKDAVKFNMMIDCGCIDASKGDFDDAVADLTQITNGIIDLLIVTHEHADHINGFEKTSTLFNNVSFKKVWFAWTEEDESFANDFRAEHTKMKLAVHTFSNELKKLESNKTFQAISANEYNHLQLNAAYSHFINQLTAIDSLNLYENNLSLDDIPTMEDKLRKWKVIKPKTVVEFKSPGEVIENLKGLPGIRFFILGPPKNNDEIKVKERKGEGYEKREHKSEFNHVSLNGKTAKQLIYAELPFNESYVSTVREDQVKSYKAKANEWRNIDFDWMFQVGNLALRHETSINNTSLSVAIQFTDSERVLLFPGDAEHGHWLSWFNEDLNWKIKDSQGKSRKVRIEYLLENTVFYKVGHHLSQNGTLKQKGLEMMPDGDLTAMVTLDLDSARNGWKNTMPNDLIGAELIRKTKGKLYFLGDCNHIMENIETDRVSVSKVNKAKVKKLNSDFDDNIFIECTING